MNHLHCLSKVSLWGYSTNGFLSPLSRDTPIDSSIPCEMGGRLTSRSRTFHTCFWHFVLVFWLRIKLSWQCGPGRYSELTPQSSLMIVFNKRHESDRYRSNVTKVSLLASSWCLFASDPLLSETWAHLAVLGEYRFSGHSSEARTRTSRSTSSHMTHSGKNEYIRGDCKYYHGLAQQ